MAAEAALAALRPYRLSTDDLKLFEGDSSTFTQLWGDFRDR
jgi:hypothetical protein